MNHVASTAKENGAISAGLAAVSWPALIESAAVEVFSMMVGSEVVVPSRPVEIPRHGLTAVVGLAGSPCGLFGVRCEAKTAETIAQKMLGLDGEALPADQVSDAIGEVCNMVAGAMKSRLSDGGAGCMMSVPTVVRGADYEVRSLIRETGYRVAMLCNENPILFTLELQS